jgi:DNA-binding IclR family transcriptional regulator
VTEDQATAAASTSGPRARGLSTARAVLHVLTLLARNPEGVTAHEVAAETGKSVSTAYNLLDSLGQEGFAVHDHGRYRLADPAEAVAVAVAGGRAPRPRTGLPEGLVDIVDELFARTHKRAYLAVVRSGRMVIVVTRGHQGIRRIPGLGTEIGANAHALALGKVGLSLLDRQALLRYVGHRLPAFTARTIVRPQALIEELDAVRRTGLAEDREEFQDNFCCLAAPVFDRRRRAVAALGLSTTRRCFETEHDELAAALLEVARQGEAALTQARSSNHAGTSSTFLKPRSHGSTVDDTDAATSPRSATSETEVSA